MHPGQPTEQIFCIGVRHARDGIHDCKNPQVLLAAAGCGVVGMWG